MKSHIMNIINKEFNELYGVGIISAVIIMAFFLILVLILT